MRVNKTNFQMKGFALGLALKQRQNVTWKSPIGSTQSHNVFSLTGTLPGKAVCHEMSQCRAICNIFGTKCAEFTE